MDDRDALTRLRAVVGRGRHAELVAALRHEPWPGASLQLIGDGLLAALRDGIDGSVDLTQAYFTALHEREWDGDRELADALIAALGTGPNLMLRARPVDLEELATILEGDPVHGGGRIELRTGEVWPQSALEYAEEIGEIDEDPERWLWVHCAGRTTATGTWSRSQTTS